MTHRRILYGLLLVAVFLFQTTNDNYLAPILLTLALTLPVLSLLLSLPVILSCRLSMRTQSDRVARGTESQWIIAPSLRIRLPLPRFQVQTVEENLLTGAKAQQKLVLNGAVHQMAVRVPANTTHCGLLKFHIKKVKVYDYLGLFAIPLPKPDPAQLLVEPLPVDPGPLHIPEGWGVRSAPGSAPKRSFGEDYDLREYRPGDPMRSVHWKLSSKWDDLIVREPVATVAPLLVLAFDWFGTPERLDALLDKLVGYSRAFLAVQRPHAFQWSGLTGAASLHSIADEKELRDGLFALLSCPAPFRLLFPIQTKPPNQMVQTCASKLLPMRRWAHERTQTFPQRPECDRQRSASGICISGCAAHLPFPLSRCTDPVAASSRNRHFLL